MKRAPTIGLLGIGGLAAALGAGRLDIPVVTAGGWVVVAGAFLTLMLRGPGLRVMGCLLSIFAVGSAVFPVIAGGWALLLLIPLAMVLVGAVSTFRSGPRWVRSAGAGPREAPADDWKQFDDGHDPTDVVGPEDPR